MPTDEPSERRLRRAAVALGSLPALALVGAELWAFGDLAGFPLDDPWIHLTFARRLAAGAGLSYPGADLVAGSTAPLWTALLAAAAALPLSLGALATLAKLGGVALHLVTVALAWRVARRLDLASPLAALAAVLVGWSEGLVFAAGSGMEVALFVALVLAGLARHLDERRHPALPPLSFLIFALGALARPEGLLLLPLAALDRLRPGRRQIAALARGIALAAIVLVPVGLAFWAMSGSPLPTTLAAKSPGPPRGYPVWRDLRTVLDLLFAMQPLPTLLAAAGAVELARRAGGPRDRGLLLASWTAALPVASSMLASESLHPGNFGRYFFPLLPCVVLLGVLGLEPLALERRRRLAALVALLLLGPALARSLRALPLELTARANVEATDLAAARWLAANTPADALVATVDIGVLGARLPNPLLDLGGIVHPERQRFFARARAERGLDWPRALRAWIEERQPEYLVVFPAWWPLAEREPARFPPLARFRIRDNVAMAGDELVVYATPWTRTAPVRPPARAEDRAPVSREAPRP